MTLSAQCAISTSPCPWPHTVSRARPPCNNHAAACCLVLVSSCCTVAGLIVIAFAAYWVLDLVLQHWMWRRGQSAAAAAGAFEDDGEGDEEQHVLGHGQNHGMGSVHANGHANGHAVGLGFAQGGSLGSGHGGSHGGSPVSGHRSIGHGGGLGDVPLVEPTVRNHLLPRLLITATASLFMYYSAVSVSLLGLFPCRVRITARIASVCEPARMSQWATVGHAAGGAPHRARPPGAAAAHHRQGVAVRA